METQAATGRSEPARQRRIDSDQFERFTEPMSVAFTGPGLADVTRDGSTYEVKLGGGVYES